MRGHFRSDDFIIIVQAYLISTTFFYIHSNYGSYRLNQVVNVFGKPNQEVRSDWGIWIKMKRKKRNLASMPLLNFDCAQNIGWWNERQNWMEAERMEVQRPKKWKNWSAFRRNNLILNRIESGIIASTNGMKFFPLPLPAISNFSKNKRVRIYWNAESRSEELFWNLYLICLLNTTNRFQMT